MVILTKVLVCIGRFSYTEISKVLSGPGETKVSRNGMDPSVLGVSWVNLMFGLMVLMCCRKWLLYSAL